jgi:hypothetical protein
MTTIEDAQQYMQQIFSEATDVATIIAKLGFSKLDTAIREHATGTAKTIESTKNCTRRLGKVEPSNQTTKTLKDFGSVANRSLQMQGFRPPQPQKLEPE